MQQIVLSNVPNFQYSGAWKNGQFHGHGTYHWSDGREFEGDFVYGKSHGQGVLTFTESDRKLKYEGAFENDVKSGSGTLHLKNGQQYSQEWSKGKKV